MLGQTYREGPNLNDNEWNLDNNLGLKFEDHVFNILSKEMEELDEENNNYFNVYNSYFRNNGL